MATVEPKRPAPNRSRARAAVRPAGRTRAEFGDLWFAEEIMLKAAASGEEAEVTDNLPTVEDRERNAVRAGFLRFLVLGGDEATAVHESGISLIGAWIVGDLNLMGIATKSRLIFHKCMFGYIEAEDAEIGLLSLAGSRLRRGLSGERMRCAGGVYLRNGFVADAPVVFKMATIGTDLDCSGGIFVSPIVAVTYTGGKVESPAIDTPEMIEEEVARRDKTIDLIVDEIGEARRLAAVERKVAPPGKSDARAQADKEAAQSWLFDNRDGPPEQWNPAPAIDLMGATVTRAVFLNAAWVTGEARMNNARIGSVYTDNATIVNPKKTALNLAATALTGELRLVYATRIVGHIDLNLASAATHADRNTTAWMAEVEDIVLDGFTYTRIFDYLGEDPSAVASAKPRSTARELFDWVKKQLGRNPKPPAGYPPVPVEVRRAWLDKQPKEHRGISFRPQPWEQVISVLRASGHPIQARELAIAKQDAFRRAGKVKDWQQWIVHRLWGWGVGYGYRSYRLFFLMFFVWLGFGTVYHMATHDTRFGTSPNLLAPTKSSDSKACLIKLARDPDATCPEPVINARTYRNFNAYAYSFDLIVPAIGIKYSSDWKPVTESSQGDTDWRGWVLTIMTWFELALGWIGTPVLALAVGSALVRKD